MDHLVSPQRILITGGFGYLGGRLAQYLTNQSGYEIFLASRQKRNAPSWLPQVKILQINWDKPADIDELCSCVDIVVHLSGMNAQDCISDPTAALNVNAIATSRLLQSAIRQNVKRFIYLSTAHVYDSPLSGTITEDTCPVNFHPYATSHRAGEDVVRNAHCSGEIEGIVIRLSNAFGVPAHKGTNCWMLLVNDLCRQAVTEKQLVMKSTGLQHRDFITLTDTVRAIEHLIESPISKLSNGLFNLGGNGSLQIFAMAKDIAERCYVLFGFRPSIQRPEEINSTKDLKSLDYRIDKLLETGFNLNKNFNTEIDGTLNFCDDNFKVK